MNNNEVDTHVDDETYNYLLSIQTKTSNDKKNYQPEKEKKEERKNNLIIKKS